MIIKDETSCLYMEDLENFDYLNSLDMLMEKEI